MNMMTIKFKLLLKNIININNEEMPPIQTNTKDNSNITNRMETAIN